MNVAGKLHLEPTNRLNFQRTEPSGEGSPHMMLCPLCLAGCVVQNDICHLLIEFLQATVRNCQQSGAYSLPSREPEQVLTEARSLTDVGAYLYVLCRFENRQGWCEVVGDDRCPCHRQGLVRSDGL
jgi:hypothetical protein